MTATSFKALADLSAVALRAAAVQPFAPRAELALAVRGINALDFAGQPDPAGHGAADRHLKARTVRHPHAGAVLDALIAAAPSASWTGGDSAYPGEPGMETFSADYAFMSICGSARWAHGCYAVDENLGLSYTVQGPNAIYPDHAHKAIEIYYVISGKALWKRGDEPWVERYPGEVILHSAGMRHAMKTGDEPLVAMAVWISDVNSGLVVVRA